MAAGDVTRTIVPDRACLNPGFYVRGVVCRPHELLEGVLPYWDLFGVRCISNVVHLTIDERRTVFVRSFGLPAEVDQNILRYLGAQMPHH